MNVDQLKAELTKRGITFESDAKKADLLALLAADDAAKGGTITQVQDGGKGNGPAQDDDVQEIDVICNVARGQRRAGRRWPGGKTTIKVTDLTDDQAKELEDDPMFHLKRPE